MRGNHQTLIIPSEEQKIATYLSTFFMVSLRLAIQVLCDSAFRTHMFYDQHDGNDETYNGFIQYT